MSKIGKAFMSLILDKKAREALETAQARPKARPNPASRDAAPAPPPKPEPQGRALQDQLHAKLDEVQSRPRPSAAPSRQELIQNARRVHASKQAVLSDLSDEQRLKLQVLAMRAMRPSRGNKSDN